MPELRVLVTGGRDYADRETVRRTLRYLADCYIHGFRPEEIVLVHGDAPGADTLAAEEATALGWRVDEIHGWSMQSRRGVHYCLAFPGGTDTARSRRLALNAHITVIDIPEARRG